MTSFRILLTYLKHVREEFSHIVWPTTRTAISHTLVVIGMVIVIGIIIALFDRLFSLLAGRIIN